MRRMSFSADHILADGPLEQCEQRALHSPRVGAREIDRCNQPLDSLRKALVPRQRLRAPFARLAVMVLDAGAGNADRFGPERPRDPAIPLAVAIPLHRPGLSTVALG